MAAATPTRFPSRKKSNTAGDFALEVEMMNDDGETGYALGIADTTDDAVLMAEYSARYTTGDDSWCMNDWQAA